MRAWDSLKPSERVGGNLNNWLWEEARPSSQMLPLGGINY